MNQIREAFSTRLLLAFLVSIFIVACTYNEKNDFNTFDYDYEIKSYYTNSRNPDNLISIEYYNDDKLIRKYGRDGDCTTILYDETGKVKERRWGRKCNFGQRRYIYIYDSLGNHIGEYTTLDSLIKLDTIEIEQVFFYDNQNRLIRERTHITKHLDGSPYEEWKQYEYDGDKIVREKIMQMDSIIIWNGEYRYDSGGKLVEIKRIRKHLYEIERYEYAENGLLIGKEIESNEYPITPKTSFSAKNNTRTYEYDSTGFMTRETVFNHKGKAEIRTIYIKSYREGYLNKN